MPLVKVEIIRGKDSSYIKALLDGIHNALVEVFKIPEDDRIQRLVQYDSKNIYVQSNQTKNFTLIELTIFKGRSREAKKALYKKIVQNLTSFPGVPSKDIIITLNEIPLENWGIRGGKIGDEVDLGFQVEV